MNCLVWLPNLSTYVPVFVILCTVVLFIQLGFFQARSHWNWRSRQGCDLYFCGCDVSTVLIIGGTSDTVCDI